MSFVTRTLLGLVFVFATATAWADAEAPAPAEPTPAEEPAPAPEPEPAPPPEEPAPAPEPEAEAPVEEAPGNRLYAGGGFGLVENDIGDDSGTVPALNLRVGYFVLPWLAVEGQAIAGLSEADLDRAVGTEVELKRSLGVYLKPHFNFGPLDLFGTLGYADVELDVSGPGGNVEGSDAGLSYGFGTRIATSAGAFDFEYLNLLDEDEVTVEGLFLTYNRFF